MLNKCADTLVIQQVQQMKPIFISEFYYKVNQTP